MPLLPPKAVLAIAAVTEIALHPRRVPIRSKALAMRLCLPERHLEPVLQALVQHHVLEGTRGPRGGYQLARQARSITADDILRAAGMAAEMDCTPVGSALLRRVVLPVLRQAEEAFSAELARINVEDLAQSAAELDNANGSGDKYSRAFAVSRLLRSLGHLSSSAASTTKSSLEQRSI
jgi:Rrf2 family transcriptional regulator, iron-sulfur cluster assembly transcription factor